jgi:pimeloyl-ACP methyl ester carboxylesterase
MAGVPGAVATVILLAAAFVAACGLIVHALAMMLLRPSRMTDGKAMYILRRMSPGDLGMPFEPIEFTSRSSAGKPIRVAAWWIGAPVATDRTCILVHGFGDAKVGALAWGPLWRSLGWNLLLVDLRAHGESEGTYCTGGFFERDDLDAVIDSLRARKPDAAKRIALFGVSLGGAVVLAVAARRDDIDAVIADAVFADYRRAAIVHGRLIGAPLTHLTPLAIRWAERIAGARFDDVRPLDTIRTARCPVMLIHGDVDPFVVDADVIALTTVLRTRGDAERDVHLIVPGAGHCMAIVADEEEYAARLGAFLRAASHSSG